MLLDINTYVGHWPFKQLQYNTCAKLLDRMDKYSVDISVVSNLNGVFYKNTQSANEELYDELQSDNNFRGRFIPFAIINPIYAGWREDLEICVSELGMKGIRVFPQYHDYEVTDPSFIELVKAARNRGLPVAIDIRMVDSRQRSWMDIPVFVPGEKSDIILKEWQLKNVIPIIREVPDAKFIIVNVANGLRVNDEELELLKKADILFDTSGRSMSDLPDLIKKFGKEKFAFGTHAPILDYLSGRLRIEYMNDSEADEATKELLRSGNARRIISI
ncbi:MAG: amidohydrolase family protein [Bacteroidetes bacterium]|nr:amidohydrolase family protein [Bacteroidota bacterium]